MDYCLQGLSLQNLEKEYNKLMPSRNIIKIDLPHTYYHVYARGHDKMKIFCDDEDFRVFLNLVKRYLGRKIQKDNCGRLYGNFRGELELLCYCLMPNHFHLLIYQIDVGAMPKIMGCILTSYSRYFNKKYCLSGTMFGTRYKASMICRDDYLLHISRYIHLNPKNWIDYRYSSLKCYLSNIAPEWLIPNRVLDLFVSSNEYMSFLTDYCELNTPLEYENLDLIDN